jgi:bifunctional DNA-binding transcriptional regulator/antitoxin component of YhaV-PrlF toxin-antitoxin module
MNMEELFQLKIVGKRQVTLPQRLLEVLHLGEGDGFQVEVRDGKISAIRPLKLIPTDLFTPEILLELDQREQQLDAGTRRKISPSETEIMEGSSDTLPITHTRRE